MSWNKSKIAEYISKDSELAEIAPPEINFTDKRWWGSSEREFFDSQYAKLVDKICENSTFVCHENIVKQDAERIGGAWSRLSKTSRFGKTQ